MNGLILVLSLVGGAAGLASMVCAVLILRLLRQMDAPSPAGKQEKAAEAPEEATERQKSVEQGIDNLMTYDLNTMKASLKGREV